MKQLEALLSGLTFGEAPRWHGGKLWFSDFYSHRVMTVDLAGRCETILTVPQRPSGLGWTSNGDLLVVSEPAHTDYLRGRTYVLNTRYPGRKIKARLPVSERSN
ncbi:MAG: hypothetical protein WBI20_01940 [Burkholderiaceae bacterium]